MLNSKFDQNLVLESSKSNKWRFFYHGTSIVQKFDNVHQNNYSNSNIINIKNKAHKSTNHGKNQKTNERWLNLSTMPRNVFGPEICKYFSFFKDLYVDDNINEDVHSFIDKHIKGKQNNVK